MNMRRCWDGTRTAGIGRPQEEPRLLRNNPVESLEICRRGILKLHGKPRSKPAETLRQDGPGGGWIHIRAVIDAVTEVIDGSEAEGNHGT